VITVATFEPHMTSILHKLGRQSRNHHRRMLAVLTYLRAGLACHLGLTQTPVQLAPRSKCSSLHE
jgi:di/tricarboxylate transporter